MIKEVTKGEATKQHLINVGSALFHQQGFKNTGLSQILKESKVTKGSFYFHFEDKHAFGLAIIDFHVGLFKKSSKDHLNNSELSPIQKIEAFHYYFLELLKKNNFKGGCLIGNFSQEMSTLNPEYAKKISAAFDGMAMTVSNVICEGVLMGEFQSNDNIDAVANFFINSWEGALVRVKSVGNAEPLENWLMFIKQILLNK